MDAQEQDLLCIPSGKDAPTSSSPLATSAKRLADGTISRKQALKLMGAGLLRHPWPWRVVVAKIGPRGAPPAPASLPAAPRAKLLSPSTVRRPSKGPTRR